VAQDCLLQAALAPPRDARCKTVVEMAASVGVMYLSTMAGMCSHLVLFVYGVHWCGKELNFAAFWSIRRLALCPRVSESSVLSDASCTRNSVPRFRFRLYFGPLARARLLQDLCVAQGSQYATRSSVRRARAGDLEPAPLVMLATLRFIHFAPLSRARATARFA
jgi:hypothetical protein